jgi:glucosamine--fructose-6-phosphate aminotransferase (isomerizing)
MSQLLDEIRQQPETLSRLLRDGSADIAEIARQLRSRDIRFVLIAARGTSDHAATYAKYLWGSVNRLPVALAAPGLYTLYERPPRLQNTLVVGISQSGMSPDIVGVVRDARAQGMSTVAITNTPASRLGEAAEFVIDLCAGEERAVAATKTYTAQLAAVALLSAELADDATMRAQLAEVPAAVEATLALEPVATRAAERYCYVQTMAMVGRGYNYATALETALKLKELTYTSTIGYSSADFLHGPIAVVQRGYPVLLVAPSGAAYASLFELAHMLTERQAELAIVADQPEILALAQQPFALPAPLPEWLSPFTAVLPGQLLGYHLALARGLDAEHPRGLNKVTETR